MNTTPAAARARKHPSPAEPPAARIGYPVAPWAPEPIECARAIERYFTTTVEATVTEVNHLGHNVWTADAEIFHDETEQTEQRQFLIVAANHRLYVNP